MYVSNHLQQCTKVLTKTKKYQQIDYVKRMQTSVEKCFLKQCNYGYKRGLNQVANVQQNALVHPYFTLMCALTA